MSVCVVLVLSAIVLPAFTSVADSPDQREQCVKNTKAIGQALLAYAVDNDGKIMNRPDDDGRGEFYQTWGTWISPYLVSNSVFRCPAYTGPFPIQDPGGVNRPYYMTYAINYDLVGTYHDGLGGELAGAPNPGSVVMVAESSSGLSWFAGNETWNLWTCADMILHRGGHHENKALAPDCSTAENRKYCRNIIPWGSGVYKAIPAVRARVTMVSADAHARSANMTNLLPQAKDTSGKIVQPFWSGLSCDVRAVP